MISLDSTKQQLVRAWGMNEKVGINTVEIDKYFMSAILPLFPDVKDKPRKSYVRRFFFVF